MITTRNLHCFSAQEVFDFIALHLLKQGRKSSNGNSCLYRHGDLKCAAGCLIPDEDYSKGMENKGWDILVDEKIVPDFHSRLIEDMQHIHDFHDSHEWAGKLKRYTEYRNLKFRLC